MRKKNKSKVKVVSISAAIGAAVVYVTFELLRFVTSAGDRNAGVINRFWHSKLGYKLGLRAAILGNAGMAHSKPEPTKPEESTKEA